MVSCRYNDDEPTKTGAAGGHSADKAGGPEVTSMSNAAYEEAADYAEHNGSGDVDQKVEYDDDEDDVDFNLGNGAAMTIAATAAARADTPPYTAPAPAPASTKLAPNAKEDG